MDKRSERSGRDKILRRVARALAGGGFRRTKPTFFTRVRGVVIEFIHLHKFSHGPRFRLHLGVRVITDARDHVVLNGPTDQEYRGRRKYDLSFHSGDESHETCATNIVMFCETVAEPWFQRWGNPRNLMRKKDSPFADDPESKERLQNALSGTYRTDDLSASRAVLGIRGDDKDAARRA